MPGIGGRAFVAVTGAGALFGLLSALPSYASPLDKTVDFTFAVCLMSAGECNPPQHEHIYVSSGGHVFAYRNASGGGESALGAVSRKGNVAGRYTVQGDSLVFDAATAQGGMAMTLRVYVTVYGSSCSISGGATMNGQAMPIQIRSGPCRVYEGHKDY